MKEIIIKIGNALKEHCHLITTQMNRVFIGTKYSCIVRDDNIVMFEED